jgi:DNA-directed RNA polymerase specialized sigma24 family protein
MDENPSVTTWIGRLEAGDEMAAQRLWERYFTKLVELAHGRLRGVPRQSADEEDVALSAFRRFCEAVSGKRVPQLKDRDDLWRILVRITVSKAIDQRRRHFSQKRGGGRGATGGAPEALDDELGRLESVVGHEPDPALAAQIADELQALLARLPREALRQMALLKLDGYTNEEIVARMNISLRSVARGLVVIRAIWEEAGAAPPP